MKKILFNTLPMAMVMLASLTACSSDDMANDGNGKGKPQLDIQLSENDFGSDDDATRYIMADSYVVDSQQVDLGNGYVADVIITKDPAESSDDNTRAFGDGNGDIANARAGAYTILAYSGSTLKKQFTGTTDGNGNFTKSGDWTIPEGSYNFICYRPEGFSVLSNIVWGITSNWDFATIGNQAMSLMSDLVPKTIQSGTNTIDFTLHQKACGVRVKFDLGEGTTNSYKDFAATITTPNASTYYRLPDLTPQRTASGTKSKDCTFAEKETNYTATDYIYFPDGIAATDMKIKFTGGKVLIPTKEGFDPLSVDLTNKEIALSGFTTTSSHRYTVNIKLNTSTVYRTVVSTEKSMTATPSEEQKASWGEGTISFVNNTGCVIVSPFSATYDNVVYGYKDNKVDVKVTPSEHSLYTYTKSTVSGLSYIYNDTFTVIPKDMHGKTLTVNFLKKWQENADGSRILRGRFTQDEEIVVATKTDAEGHQYKCIFRTNGTLSYFYITRDDVSQSVTIDGYNFELDQNTGIYTLTIADKSTSDCVNSKAQGDCTASSYGKTMLSACPVTCNNINVADSYK